MKISEAPAFLTERRVIPSHPKRASLKTARKKGKIVAPRFEGDTGTAEFKKREKIIFEVRARSSTGHATSIGARVESQLPLDRYKNRGELDPDNAWRNIMLWEGAERLRRDFEASGMAPKVCGSFQPRIKGGPRGPHTDNQIDAWNRYRKSMDAVGQSLRPVIFYVAIAGEAANDWARRNAMLPQAGLTILRLALAELAHHYGLCKIVDH